MQEVVGSTPILSTLAHKMWAFFRFMPFYIYILYSSHLDQYYIGHTENVADRIFRHTNSGSKSTKKASDWEIKYTEEFHSRQEAMQREVEIKKKKSRKYLEWLVSSVS